MSAGRPARLSVGVVSAGRVGRRRRGGVGRGRAPRRRRVRGVPGLGQAGRGAAAGRPAAGAGRGGARGRPGPAGRPGRRAARAGPRAGRGGQLPGRPDRGAHLRARTGWRCSPRRPSTGVLPLALHPVMTFTGRVEDVARLAGCSVGVTATAGDEAGWSVGEALVVEMGAEPVRVDEAGPPALPRRARARRQPPGHAGPRLRATPWSGPASTRPTGWSPRCCRRRWTTRCGTATARSPARWPAATSRPCAPTCGCSPPTTPTWPRPTGCSPAAPRAAPPPPGCCPSRPPPRSDALAAVVTGLPEYTRCRSARAPAHLGLGPPDAPEAS